MKSVSWMVSGIHMNVIRIIVRPIGISLRICCLWLRGAAATGRGEL